MQAGIKRALLSYHYIRGKDIDRLPYDEVFIDSGAYSAANSGKPIDIQEYIDWISNNLAKHDNIVAYANLDDIKDWQISVKNQETMEAAGLEPVPCYHYGEPAEVLEQYCRNHDYIGLGGLVSREMKTDTRAVYWENIQEMYPGKMFHLFGVSTPQVFYLKQPHSLDSTSWGRGSRYGGLAGYVNGLPQWFNGIRTDLTGFKHFFTPREIDGHNIRAMLDWEKCEWIGKINGPDGDQGRLI